MTDGCCAWLFFLNLYQGTRARDQLNGHGDAPLRPPVQGGGAGGAALPGEEQRGWKQHLLFRMSKRRIVTFYRFVQEGWLKHESDTVEAAMFDQQMCARASVFVGTR